jgi:hypothetical protein
MVKMYLNGADPRAPLAAPIYADLKGLAFAQATPAKPMLLASHCGLRHSYFGRFGHAAALGVVVYDDLIAEKKFGTMFGRHNVIVGQKGLAHYVSHGLHRFLV